MKLHIFKIYTFLLLFFMGVLYSQNYDNRLLNHYSEDELNDLKTNNIEKYNTIHYYYTQSYSIETYSCEECLQIDLSTFDISKYEYFRKQSEVAVFDNTKYGIRISLVPIDLLLYKLPIHTQHQ